MLPTNAAECCVRTTMRRPLYAYPTNPAHGRLQLRNPLGTRNCRCPLALIFLPRLASLLRPNVVFTDTSSQDRRKCVSAGLIPTTVVSTWKTASSEAQLAINH